MGYQHLTQHQRYQIATLHKGGLTSRQIADSVECHHSTVAREINRNGGRGSYHAQQADRLATRRRHVASIRPRINPETWALVEKHLREDWSPEQIVRSGAAKVSIERIYQHIAADRTRGGDALSQRRLVRALGERRGHGDIRGMGKRPRLPQHGRGRLIYCQRRVANLQTECCFIEAMARIPGNAMLAVIKKTPGGAYARQACFFWEKAHGATLEGAPAVTGAQADVFDARHYVTGPSRRQSRWRVNFNGIGDPTYCPVVERTPLVDEALGSSLLSEVNTYAGGLDRVMRDRALSWAYLHETRDSYAIEKESPNEERERAFVNLLHQAHIKRTLSEDYLVELQQATVNNPMAHNAAFRGTQNWLQGPLRGAQGVTYIPPPPDLAHELMEQLMALANNAPGRINPLVAGAVVSFGFVLIHPFIDGNGRLSRFLLHHMLCQSGRLDNGLILPVSIAMKKHEADYLEALQAFSAPAREQWQVTWHDEGQYDLRFKGSPSIYRYWDATPAVEFTYRMAKQAFEIELKSETRFLAHYDRIAKRVSEQIDLPGPALTTLILSALDQQGRVSKRRRDQFRHQVPASAFDLIEAVVMDTLEEDRMQSFQT